MWMHHFDSGGQVICLFSPWYKRAKQTQNLLESLKNHDDNGNGNVPKKEDLMSRTMVVHVRYKSL